MAKMSELPGPVFHHDHLNLDTRTFRLLRILPTLDENMIQLQLTTENFEANQKGAYNALSYEWGPDEPPF
jgi:hypothetical protein